MKAKKTIAILGLKKGTEKAFLDELANNNRLLIVSEDINDCAKASDYISQTRTDYEVELVNCPKDGCWEADIIMIWNPSQFNPTELLRLQSVAIQKIVLMVLEEKIIPPPFPHSKIVVMTRNSETGEINISGQDLEAAASIYQLINKTKTQKKINYSVS